jgi:quinolinate synthase
MAVSASRIPILPTTELEQSEFCKPDNELAAKPLAEEMSANIQWQSIPDEYTKLSPAELSSRIDKARQALGDRAIILGHHYQREEVIQYADLIGDSFKLAQYAAANARAEYIFFCGVHFMAETADILSADFQQVILPNMTAGCSMADMAPSDDVHDCWNDLVDLLGPQGITPITYMNSTAAIKALCGRNGGIVCTSSNASAAMEWAFEQRDKVLFLPDEHLGRNSAIKIGIPADNCVLWNPFKPLGGLTAEQIMNAKVILWRGHCSVHTRFRTAQIETARSTYPDVTVMVHPECTQEVVGNADLNGSTEQIIASVSAAPSGSVWAIGTEINLVHRLARTNPDKTIFCLDPIVCPCSTMYRTHPAYLAWVLEKAMQDIVVNRVTVPSDTKQEAFVALERMLRMGPVLTD